MLLVAHVFGIKRSTEEKYAFSISAVLGKDPPLGFIHKKRDVKEY